MERRDETGVTAPKPARGSIPTRACIAWNGITDNGNTDYISTANHSLSYRRGCVHHERSHLHHKTAGITTFVAMNIVGEDK